MFTQTAGGELGPVRKSDLCSFAIPLETSVATLIQSYHVETQQSNTATELTLLCVNFG